MLDKDLIPFLGDKTSRERFREIDENHVTLMVVIGISFSKIVESYVGLAGQVRPIEYAGLSLTNLFWWKVVFIIATLVFIHEIHIKARKAAVDVAEAGSEAIDEISED